MTPEQKIIEEFEEKFPSITVGTVEELLSAIKIIQKYPAQMKDFIRSSLSTYRKGIEEELRKEYENCPQCEGLKDKALEELAEKIRLSRPFPNAEQFTALTENLSPDQILANGVKLERDLVLSLLTHPNPPKK